MKGTLKYIMLAVIVCICSFVIYYFVGPEDRNPGISILYYEK